MTFYTDPKYQKHKPIFQVERTKALKTLQNHKLIKKHLYFFMHIFLQRKCVNIKLHNIGV